MVACLPIDRRVVERGRGNGGRGRGGEEGAFDYHSFQSLLMPLRESGERREGFDRRREERRQSITRKIPQWKSVNGRDEETILSRVRNNEERDGME